MGIESDQVVYEYLSRVGDVAQQRQLSSATRMRLVADLRNEIDKRRAKEAFLARGVRTPAFTVIEPPSARRPCDSASKRRRPEAACTDPGAPVHLER